MTLIFAICYVGQIDSWSDLYFMRIFVITLIFRVILLSLCHQLPYSLKIFRLKNVLT